MNSRKFMNKKIIALIAIMLTLMGEINARGGVGFGVGFGVGPAWGRRGYWGAPGWGWGPGIGFGIGFGGGRRYYQDPYYDYYDYDYDYDYEPTYVSPRRYRSYDDSYENPVSYSNESVPYSKARPYKNQTPISYKHYLDQDGKDSWKFFNDTPYTIRVRALRGGGRETIKSGESKEVSRGESFQFLAKSDAGHRQLFEGQDHQISIIEEDGQLSAVQKLAKQSSTKELA